MSLASEPRKICLYLKSISCKNSIFTDKEMLNLKFCWKNYVSTISIYIYM